MTAACFVVCGGGGKEHHELPEKTKEILESIREKLEHVKSGIHSEASENNPTYSHASGQDTLSGGHDTLVGGGHSEGHSDLGAISLPDLSHVTGHGAITPVTVHAETGHGAQEVDTHAAVSAPVEHVDLTLIGHAVEDLTKHLSKFST